MPTLDDYRPIVGDSTVEELRTLGDRLQGLSVKNINSTATGGGVAEILHRMVPLLRELGIDARWDCIKGGDQFFWMTKKIHNALHGAEVALTDDEIALFLETNRKNLEEIPCDAGVMFIHDPQPIAFIEKKAGDSQRWIWRCHIDLSSPDPGVWKFLKPFVERYDAAVFSAPSFSPVLGTRQFLISPSIDPLSDKNRELTPDEMEAALAPFGLDPEKPMILQVSRFDFLKDPVGVIEAYRLVKGNIDCQLALAGGTATDDPESDVVLAGVREAAGDDPDVHILAIPPGSDIAINALQRAASVVMQKSLREGFGLTVTEALWKGKPVVASHVGGIPLQIKHRYHGMLCHSVEGAAYAIRQILNSPEFGAKLGENGREHVLQNYLLTRHLKEYLLMFIAVSHAEDIIFL
jgi:trehalose synthase